MLLFVIRLIFGNLAIGKKALLNECIFHFCIKLHIYLVPNKALSNLCNICICYFFINIMQIYLVPNKALSNLCNIWICYFIINIMQRYLVNV